MSGVSGTTPDPRIEKAARVHFATRQLNQEIPIPWEALPEWMHELQIERMAAALAAVDVGNTQPEYALAGLINHIEVFHDDNHHGGHTEPFADCAWDLCELAAAASVFVRVVSATPNKEGT